MWPVLLQASRCFHRLQFRCISQCAREMSLDRLRKHCSCLAGVHLASVDRRCSDNHLHKASKLIRLLPTAMALVGCDRAIPSIANCLKTVEFRPNLFEFQTQPTFVHPDLKNSISNGDAASGTVHNTSSRHTQFFCRNFVSADKNNSETSSALTTQSTLHFLKFLFVEFGRNCRKGNRLPSYSTGDLSKFVQLCVKSCD